MALIVKDKPSSARTRDLTDSLYIVRNTRTVVLRPKYMIDRVICTETGPDKNYWSLIIAGGEKEKKKKEKNFMSELSHFPVWSWEPFRYEPG